MNFCSSCRKDRNKEDFEIVDAVMSKTCLKCKERRMKYIQKTYEKCLIYAIECLTTNEIYIGSTKMKINKRLDSHRSATNKCVSKTIIERGNYKVNILEEVSCNSKKELLIKEREYLEKLNCINKCVPTNLYKWESQKRFNEKNKDLIKKRNRIYELKRDKKAVIEKNKRYYERNKEKQDDYKKRWYVENRERILANKKIGMLANKQKSKT